jgi:hypothetical protein
MFLDFDEDTVSIYDSLGSKNASFAFAVSKITHFGSSVSHNELFPMKRTAMQAKSRPTSPTY